MNIPLAALACLLSLETAAQPPLPPDAIEFETPHLRYRISAEGRNLAFLDRETGTDYLRLEPPSACAVIRWRGVESAATAAAFGNGRLHLRFGESGLQAMLKVERRPLYLRFTVESVAGGEPEALTFLNVPLTLGGRPSDPFGACALSLNLQTRVDQLPALQTALRASGHAKFGLVGARAALVAAPVNQMLMCLKTVLAEADEMPLCRVAGPWAAEIPFNHGSYLFNFGSLTETNVSDWIQMARSLGFNQIDNHGGGAGFFRFGDFELNRQKWPAGWEDYRRIVERLHEAGIGSIFHTYAFFIDKQSRYVAPVPDPRLDAFRTFTLAAALDPEDDEIRVNEPTAGMSTLTGFFEHNSVVLQIGDELVTYGGVSQTAPWQFTGVQRGALGTTAAAHANGATARHLKECFGLFVPNPETSLFEEIAANHAAIVNQCDFDGIYLDAIDGSSILRGPDECWYWADKFVFEIQKRLRKPVGMEMSAMWHHFWQYRTRWQAWDYPQRGHKRFVDLHAQEINGGLLLPLHLGWWNFQTFQPPQIEPTYPDVLEQLGARLIGWDAGVSLTGAVDRDRLGTVPLFRRAVDILRTCEELRHSGAMDATVRAQLRDPAQAFALFTDPDGKPHFRRSRAEAHTVAVAEPWTASWLVTNPFAAQPLRLRIEALMSANRSAISNTTLLVGAEQGWDAGWQTTSAKGVSFSLAATRDVGASSSAVLTAASAGEVPRHAAWGRMQRRFAPALDLRAREALTFEIESDGLGALLAIRLESPRHLAFGAVADRYLPLDFVGRRRVTLVETESARWSDYVWNDGKGLYNVYRETIHFSAVESASVWLQNLPPGNPVRCALGRIEAVPMAACTFSNFVVTVNGQAIRFPLPMASGNWIECAGPDEAVLYGPKGETLSRMAPLGDYPSVRSGPNALSAACDGDEGAPPRFRVVLFSQGEAL